MSAKKPIESLTGSSEPHVVDDATPRDDTPVYTADIDVSFEFFPPTTDKMHQTLWATIERLQTLRPRFASVTYGAGGTTRERTHNTVKRIQRDTVMTAAGHLTCVAASKTEVDEVIRSYRSAGVKHIVALRGDPQGDSPVFEPHPQGYRNALELISGIKKIDGDFDVSVAAYPEVHPEARSASADLDFLKAKVDAGADRAITQFFFDADVFLRFRDRVQAAGLDIPILPGILPVTNFARAQRFAAGCGASIPNWLAHAFEGLDDDPETRKLVAASVASEQCRRLMDEGVKFFHFYTLNRADLTFAICRYLGIQPQPVDTRLAS